MPEFSPLRVYFDSNILFSASLNERSAFLDFWRMYAVTPVTSQYAVGEVYRNIGSPGHEERLERLLVRTGMVSDARDLSGLGQVRLAMKDQPILAAAMAASVEYLVTGDKNHFGLLYNTTVSGVHILCPADFRAAHKDRLIL